MKSPRSSKSYLAAVAMLMILASLAAPSWAQVSPINCNANVSVPPLVRAEGKAEPVGDLILSCTGGAPTPVGLPVPQVNFTLFLTTPLTSHVTHDPPDIDFSEAVLLVDEPNSLINPPQRPLLNCGQVGAPDNGGSGPGICSIVSSGIVTATYDGIGNVSGTVPCDGVGSDPAPNTFGCGRPNAFQGRLSGSASNVVEFLGVPFDPSGLGTRIFRFTNIRANASVLGSPGPFPIMVDIAVNGSSAVVIANPVQTIAFSLTGLSASISSPNVVTVTENFSSAWKDRNVAFTLANATFGGSGYTYTSGATNYPPEAAQNVPGTIYNTEDMFQWQNNGANAPPTPNPPLGFGVGPVANLGNPFLSVGFGGVNTMIDQDGVSSAGTRIALTFTHVPGHSTVTVPASVLLHPVGSPSMNSGVMVLTGTDPDGAGPFTPGVSTIIPDGGTAVYEILYTNPFVIEFADIACTPNHPGNGTRVAVSFAPFYSTLSSGFATPTATNPAPTAVPRFIPASSTLMLSK